MTATATQTSSDVELMTRYGITCEFIPRYHYKTWHYAKLSDALAQARRENAASSSAID
jgi:hypothetical protein